MAICTPTLSRQLSTIGYRHLSPKVNSFTATLEEVEQVVPEDSVAPPNRRAFSNAYEKHLITGDKASPHTTDNRAAEKDRRHECDKDDLLIAITEDAPPPYCDPVRKSVLVDKSSMILKFNSKASC